MNALADDLDPLDSTEHAEQVALVSSVLAPPCRLVDLGAGSGRVARPLAEAGCTVLAVDSDAGVLESWCSVGADGVEALNEDILAEDATWPNRGPFDAAVCLGNTLALFLQEGQLQDLFARLGASINSGGTVLIDDFPIWGWQAVESGEWCTGISEDGAAQLVWVPGEPLFVYRRGAQVDPESERPRPEERLLRLWSARELAEAAAAHGFSEPWHRPEGHLIQFNRS